MSDVRPRLAAALVASTVLALTGCGASDEVGTEIAYAGPLYVDAAQAQHRRAGAAGDVVQCRVWGAGGTNGPGRDGVYAEGATAPTAAQALEVGRGEGAFEGVLRGLVLARVDQDRALYVLASEGVVSGAVVVREGPATDGAGGPTPPAPPPPPRRSSRGAAPPTARGSR